MTHRLLALLAVTGTFCVLGHSVAQQRDDSKVYTEKKTGELAAEFEYPGAKQLEKRNGTVVYFSVRSTSDELAKVAAWYDKKARFGEGATSGVASGADFARRSVFQDGGRTDVEELAKRPVTVRSYVIRTTDHTVAVVISRPKVEKHTIISVTYIPEYIPVQNK